MILNTEEYGSVGQGSSINKPVSSEDLSKLIDKALIGDLKTNPFGKQNLEDELLIADIQNMYAEILDSVGLNIADPLQAYSTHFNKNMQTLGLDPQRPGNSHVFITRPDLNLSPKNVREIPFFDYIFKTEIGNLVGEYLQYPGKSDSAVNLASKFKTSSCFDPLLSNTCKEVSGVRDLTMDRYETVGDFFGHSNLYANGADGYDGIGELTLTFEDAYMSPVFLKHYIWFMYIHYVTRGYINPTKESIMNRIIDYSVSIYIFKLAEDNRTILRFGKFTGCFPLNVPLDTLNHSREIKLEEYDTVSITYGYNYYEPMNPKIMADFNMLAMRTIAKDGNIAVPGVFNDKENVGGFNFKIKDESYPDRILERVEKLNGADSLWAGSPFIIGDKLYFV